MEFEGLVRIQYLTAMCSHYVIPLPKIFFPLLWEVTLFWSTKRVKFRNTWKFGLNGDFVILMDFFNDSVHYRFGLVLLYLEHLTCALTLVFMCYGNMIDWVIISVSGHCNGKAGIKWSFHFLLDILKVRTKEINTAYHLGIEHHHWLEPLEGNNHD